MIVHLGTVRVHVDLTRLKTVVSLILRSFPIQFFAVYTLSLQFNPTDDDILASIAKFVPMVRVLQLWERADYTVSHFCLHNLHDHLTVPQPLHPHTPHPWQHAKTLRDNLLKMRFLDSFIVRTTAAFVLAPGLAQERTVISKWVGEKTPSRTHPRLSFVGVWYRATQFGAGTLTKWRKNGEVWTGASVDSPTQDDLGVLL